MTYSIACVLKDDDFLFNICWLCMLASRFKRISSQHRVRKHKPWSGKKKKKDKTNKPTQQPTHHGGVEHFTWRNGVEYKRVEAQVAVQVALQLHHITQSIWWSSNYPWRMGMLNNVFGRPSRRWRLPGFYIKANHCNVCFLGNEK